MIRLSRNSLLAKHANNIEILSSQARDRFSPADNGYAWRDEDDSFFTPLPLDKFLFDHLGVKLYPKQEEDLQALLGVDPKQVFESETGLPQQAALMWGKGSGKDFVVSCLMMWAMQVLLCLKDPAVYLGQAYGENIDVLTVAYNKDQAISVLFFKIKARLKSCPWFVEAITLLCPGVNPERYLKDGNGFVGADNILFPGNLRMWAVPATDAAEGKNPIIWVADEIAAFSSPVRMNQAKHIHKILRTSARTRFGDRWKGLLISYPRHRQDYMFQTYERAKKGELTDMYAVKRSTWEVNLSRSRASLQPDYDDNPEDARAAYECDPPAQIDAYFRSPELLLLHATGAPLNLLQQHLDLPIEQLEAIAQLGQNPILEEDQWGDPVLDRRGFPKLARWLRGQKDAGGIDYEYFVHLDPGLSGDAFGFAMGHIHKMSDGSSLPTLDLCFRWTGGMFRDFGEIYRQSWFIDTVEQYEQISAAEVDFRTVREFIFFLKLARGFNIALLTTDRWNSAESIQELRKRDIPVGVRTVNKEDYDEFKSLVYNRNLAYYGWTILIEEARKLQLVNGGRVEAPRTSQGEGQRNDSHKDVTDGAASVCRRMVSLKDETTKFYQFPSIEDIWDEAQKTGQPVKVEMSPDSMSELQQKIMTEFFGD